MSTYQVIRVANLWRVIDRSQGGKVLAFRESYKAAVEYAKDREFVRSITLGVIALDQQEQRWAA